MRDIERKVIVGRFANQRLPAYTVWLAGWVVIEGAKFELVLAPPPR